MYKCPKCGNEESFYCFVTLKYGAWMEFYNDGHVKEIYIDDLIDQIDNQRKIKKFECPNCKFQASERKFLNNGRND